MGNYSYAILARVALLGLCNCATVAATADQSGDWTRTIGGPGRDSGRAVAASADGMCSTGSFQGATLSIRPAQLEVASADADGAFIACFDQTGTLQWHTLISGGGAQVTDIVRLPDNQVYVAGLFGGVARVQGASGSHALHGLGGVDAFLIKLAADGRLLWHKVFANSQGSQAWKLAHDGSGGVIVQGTYHDSLEFADSRLTAVGQRDLFLARVRADGHLLWLTSLGSSKDEAFGDLAVSGDSIYELLATEGSMTDLSPADLERGHGDVLLLQRKLDDGKVNWYRRIGGPGMDYAGALSAGNNGDVYAAVSFQDRAWIFRPEAANTSRGSMDIMVAAFDATGDLRWVHSDGDSGTDMVTAMTLDCSGEHLLLAYLRSSTAGNATGTALQLITVEDGRARDITTDVLPGQSHLQVLSLTAFGEHGLAFSGTLNHMAAAADDAGAGQKTGEHGRVDGKSDAVTGVLRSGSC